MKETALPSIHFVGIDIGTRSIMVAAVDGQQQIVLQPKKIPVDRFDAWACQNIHQSDAVVFEATSSAWQYYDQLVRLTTKVIVAKAQAVKALAAARVKTDARDAVALARLLAVGMVPAVWVPPQPVRELRALVAHRLRLVQQRTRAKNRLQGLILAHRLLPPEGNPFADANRSWWEAMPLTTAEKLRLRHEFSVLANLEPLIAEADAELIRESTTETWATQTAFVVQVPGIGVLTAMIILSAIGDIRRFATAKDLVGYSGLGASVFATGQTYRTGGITKQGRPELRTALVEAAWVAIQTGHWKDVFERLQVRVGKAKAVVAIARKLLVTVWHVLTKGQADAKNDPERIARKILTWGVHLRKAGRRGVPLTTFTRAELDRLGLGEQVATVRWAGKTVALAPPEKTG